MKSCLTTIIAIMSYFCMIGSGLWAIVSFLIYLVKDEPFDWRSIWSIGFSFALFIVSLLFTVFFKYYEAKEDLKPSNIIKKRSGFLQRLEAAQRKRNEENK